MSKNFAAGRLGDSNIVIGDQGDPATLDQWVYQTGGNFDVVIDDGSHLNDHMLTSFKHLWPHVVPGGLYFVEDITYSRFRQKHTVSDGPTMENGGTPFVEVIKDWIDQLLVHPLISSDAKGAVSRNPIPEQVDFINCFSEACVIGKKMVRDHDWADSSTYYSTLYRNYVD